MIAIKSPEEQSRMRASGKIVGTILEQLAHQAVVGVTLLELDAEAERLTLSLGAVPAFKGYKGFPFTLCTSVNEQVVHGMPSDRKLEDGDLLSLDFGVRYEGYYGDSAVTIGIGTLSAAAERLRVVTREALYRGIAESRPGRTVRDIARAVEGAVKPHRFGIVREFVGHGIGTKLHEEPQIPNYELGAQRIPLRAGMAIAIEPMVTAGRAAVRLLSDGWTAVTADRSLAAHFEHTILIGEEGPEILTEWESGLLGEREPISADRGDAKAGNGARKST